MSRERLRRGASVLLVVIGLAVAGCASMPGSRGAPAAPSAGDGPAVEIRQSLYRLTYDGGEGRTTLKVVLRQSADDRFQLVFSDIAGRRVWALDHRPERSILVDHRQATYCVSGSELKLPQVHPDELPLAAIPRVLAGLLPVAGDPGPTGEFSDSAGRRWRAVYRGAALESWSLLDDEGPSLWWQPDREGGILSRRGGEQYRWQLVVTESSVAILPGIVPGDFVEEACSE